MNQTGQSAPRFEQEASSREERRTLFDALFGEQFARLVQALAFIALDEDEARDAAQHAFLQLWVKWDKVSAYDDPQAWVFRVAVNRIKDERRAAKRLGLLLSRLASVGGGSPEVVTWQPDTDLLAAFKRLPTGQRTAASLYYLADLSVEGVARVMGISEGTVNSHLHRAREALRVLLEAK